MVRAGGRIAQADSAHRVRLDIQQLGVLMSADYDRLFHSCRRCCADRRRRRGSRHRRHRFDVHQRAGPKRSDAARNAYRCEQRLRRHRRRRRVRLRSRLRCRRRARRAPQRQQPNGMMRTPHVHRTGRCAFRAAAVGTDAVAAARTGTRALAALRRDAIGEGFRPPGGTARADVSRDDRQPPRHRRAGARRREVRHQDAVDARLATSAVRLDAHQPGPVA